MRRWFVAVFLFVAVPAFAQGPAVFMAGHSGLPKGIPNACAVPTITTAATGTWESPTTWTGGRIPANTDRVLVRAGHVVSLNSVRTEQHECVQIDGAVRFSTTEHTRLRVGTLYVNEGGLLEVGTPSQPVPSTISARISFLPVTFDPDQFNGGLIGMGTVTMRGANKLTFIRVASEPLQGQSTVTIALPQGGQGSGWAVGDELILPDTRALLPAERFAGHVSQVERARITAISGNVYTVNHPWAFNHSGSRTATNQVEFLPHVMNMTRNVVIDAEAPTGTRGHTLYTHRATVDVQYVEHRDIGRTRNGALTTANPAGRYAFHAHHLMGPASSTMGYQFRFIGNSVIDTVKWAVTVHNTHYGLVEDNVCAFADGFCFGTEDGNESNNWFHRNMGVMVRGDREPRDLSQQDAVIFGFHGFNNRITDNVASSAINHFQSNSAGIGYNFQVAVTSYQVMQRIPISPGADPSLPGQFINQNLMCTRIPDFSNNEAYGGMALGMELWNLGTDGYTTLCDGKQYPAIGQSQFINNRFWHTWNAAFYGYPARNLLFDGFVARSKPTVIDGDCGWDPGDYQVSEVVIRNADIRGWWNCGIAVGSGMQGQVRIENTALQNAGSNIRIERFSTPGTGAQVLARTTTITNAVAVQWPNSIFTTLEKAWSGGSGNGSNQASPNVPDLTYVYSSQGRPTDNFQVYYLQQSQWPYQGGLAPCTTTQPNAVGYFCPIAAPGFPVPQAPTTAGITP